MLVCVFCCCVFEIVFVLLVIGLVCAVLFSLFDFNSFVVMICFVVLEVV